MNGPMIRLPNVPDGWFCNAHTEHGKVDYRYNSRGRVEKMDGPCMCSACIRQRNPNLREGTPVSVHVDWSEEVLKEKGYVGLYDHEDVL